MSKVFHNISEVRLSEVHLSKVHHRLCGIIPFHRFTKNFLPRSTLARGNHKGISKVHKGPPPSLWNTNISQVHQEFPSYPRSTLAQGNHRGVFQGPPRSTTISVGYNHFTGSPRISFQGPPWPKEIIKVYPRSTKVHHHPCGIQPFHRLTKNFLLIQDSPWPKETIKVYPRSIKVHHHLCGF